MVKTKSKAFLTYFEGALQVIEIWVISPEIYMISPEVLVSISGKITGIYSWVHDDVITDVTIIKRYVIYIAQMMIYLN